MISGRENPVCFPPLCNGSEKVLILGSFPGILSLEKQQYYAHPRNSFWPIMGRLCGFDPLLSYQKRVEYLSLSGIALWDVLTSCSRDGSLDSSIKKKSMVINDFEDFFEENSLIQWVFFNGSMSENQFKKKVWVKQKVQARMLSLHRLPSTSPAMARLDFEQKVRAWSIVGEVIANHGVNKIPNTH